LFLGAAVLNLSLFGAAAGTLLLSVASDWIRERLAKPSK
jgi:hypothetical protein